MCQLNSVSAYDSGQTVVLRSTQNHRIGGLKGKAHLLLRISILTNDYQASAQTFSIIRNFQSLRLPMSYIHGHMCMPCYTGSSFYGAVAVSLYFSNSTNSTLKVVQKCI